MRCSAANAAYRLVRGRPHSGEAQFAASGDFFSARGYLVVRCQCDIPRHQARLAARHRHPRLARRVVLITRRTPNHERHRRSSNGC